jgi:hypothetical protein
MRKIGVLYGMENTFPQALVQRINDRNVEDISAEFIRVGTVQAGQKPPYNVIVDRVSAEIDFYGAYLRNAAVSGTHIINDPFRWSADDKFYTYSLALELGLTVPNTLVVPHKAHPPGTTVQSMRNLEFPLDWDAAFACSGFPAYLKTLDGKAWGHTYKVHSPEEFFRAYDQTGSVCMVLQQAIEDAEYYRAYVIGQEARVMRYNRNRPYNQRLSAPADLDSAVCDRLISDSLKLCHALGYDINCLEYAVKDGAAYGIDLYNPVPDFDEHAVGPENFGWIVEAVTDLAIAKARLAEAPQTNTRERTRPLAAASR